MKLKFTGDVVVMGVGRFKPGDVAELREADGRPLCDAGHAIEIRPQVADEVDVLLACNVENLDAMLAHYEDPIVIGRALEQDARKSAHAKYRARINALADDEGVPE